MLNELSNGDLFTNSSEEVDKELLVLYIEITENNTQVLTINSSDSVEEAVQKFCADNELTPSAQTYIQEEVEKNLQFFYPSAPLHLPESIDQELTSEIKFGDCNNKGVELYLRGQKMREKTEKKREMIRNQRKLDEEKMVTLKPVVNGNGEKRSKRPEQILLEKGRQTAEKLNRKRAAVEAKAKNECTFSPEINKNKNEARSPDRHQRLFEDAQTIHEKILKKSEDL